MVDYGESFDVEMAPSSSGPGHQVLILKIAGSNPAGVTKKKVTEVSTGYLFFVVKFPICYWVRTPYGIM